MNTTTVLDAELFLSLQRAAESVNDVEVISEVMYSAPKEYARFITNEVENPHFKARRKNFDIDTARAAIATCAAEIEASSAPEVVLQLYRAKLHNQELRFELLNATAGGDDATFTAQSQKLYGRPRKDIFSMIVHYVLRTKSQSPEAEKALQTLTDAVGHVAKPKEMLPVDILPPVIKGDTKVLTAAAVQKIFTELLQEEGLHDWTAIVDESCNRSRFSVSPFLRIVYIPCDEQLQQRPQPMTETSARAIGAHEIGVHAKRSANGMTQSLKLLSIGLDGYLRGEEGLASYAQQQVEGATQFYGLDRYLAISLALGLDRQPRDFRSVFTLMLAYYRLTDSSGTRTQESLIQQTWSVCHRIFRGTTGQSVGAVFTRDIAYLEGNLLMWDYIIAHPERYEALLLGKFDPLNDRHVKSLQTLDILPQW